MAVQSYYENQNSAAEDIRITTNKLIDDLLGIPRDVTAETNPIIPAAENQAESGTITMNPLYEPNGEIDSEAQTDILTDDEQEN